MHYLHWCDATFLGLDFWFEIFDFEILSEMGGVMASSTLLISDERSSCVGEQGDGKEINEKSASLFILFSYFGTRGLRFHLTSMQKLRLFKSAKMLREVQGQSLWDHSPWASALPCHVCTQCEYWSASWHLSPERKNVPVTGETLHVTGSFPFGPHHLTGNHTFKMQTKEIPSHFLLGWETSKGLPHRLPSRQRSIRNP